MRIRNTLAKTDRVGNQKPTQKNPKKPPKNPLKNLFGVFFGFFKSLIFFLKIIQTFLFTKNSNVCTQLRIIQKEIKSTLNQELMHRRY
jgi:hypothetical protein